MICDKPLSTTLAEAEALVALAAAKRSRKFFVTLNNTGYAMVRQAREMVAAGELGTLVAVHASYIQDWLTRPIDAEGQKQAEWRTDPARAGAVGGARRHRRARLQPRLLRLRAARPRRSPPTSSPPCPGRRLDDNAHVLVRWSGGARGTIVASQTSPGHYNDLSVRVYGDRAGLEWTGSRPEELRFSRYGEEARDAGARRPRLVRREPRRLAHAGGASRRAISRPSPTLPRRRGRSSAPTAPAPPVDPARAALVPDVVDGARGVKFVAAAVESNAAGGAWTAAGI